MASLTKLSKPSKLKRFLLMTATGVVISLACVAPASANQFDEAVDQIDDISETIQGIVTGMTQVAILPMGISSAMKAFRHIVLNNV
jgi:hypothetical protein